MILDNFALLLVLVSSFMACLALIQAHKIFQRTRFRRDDLSRVQSTHLRCTPRTGGVAVLLTIIGSFFYILPLDKAALAALTLLPVFLAGLAEDTGFNVSPRRRLIAAALSAALAIIILGIWIPPVDITGLDMLLTIPLLAIALTIFWATGICHAINLIDGIHGLAATTALLIATALALIAAGNGASTLAILSIAIAAALLGFLLLNWPFGLIFLGDAGAYCLGHLLVWLAIALSWYYPQVSGIALSLMFFWPVADTLLAIFRRLLLQRPISSPDRIHFHQMVMRGLIILSNGRLTKPVANPLTTLVLLPLISAPIVTAVILQDRPAAALVAWGIYGVIFWLTYALGVLFFRTGRAGARRHCRRRLGAGR